MSNITKSHYKNVEWNEEDKLYYARHRIDDGMGCTIMDFDEYTSEEWDALDD